MTEEKLDLINQNRHESCEIGKTLKHLNEELNLISKNDASLVLRAELPSDYFYLPIINKEDGVNIIKMCLEYFTKKKKELDDFFKES